jgi:hypothetical protein
MKKHRPLRNQQLRPNHFHQPKFRGQQNRQRRRWPRLDAASERNFHGGGSRSMPGFLQRAHSDGLNFVLVITGKGRATGADPERGVLRRQVPQWLSLPEFRSLVVGFEEAHVGHGGEGALYVRIRRSKL